MSFCVSLSIVLSSLVLTSANSSYLVLLGRSEPSTPGARQILPGSPSLYHTWKLARGNNRDHQNSLLLFQVCHQLLSSAVRCPVSKKVLLHIFCESFGVFQAGGQIQLLLLHLGQKHICIFLCGFNLHFSDDLRSQVTFPVHRSSQYLLL